MVQPVRQGLRHAQRPETTFRTSSPTVGDCVSLLPTEVQGGEGGQPEASHQERAQRLTVMSSNTRHEKDSKHRTPKGHHDDPSQTPAQLTTPKLPKHTVKCRRENKLKQQSRSINTNTSTLPIAKGATKAAHQVSWAPDRALPHGLTLPSIPNHNAHLNGDIQQLEIRCRRCPIVDNVKSTHESTPTRSQPPRSSGVAEQGSRALAPTMSRREEAAEAWPGVDNIAFQLS